MIKEGDLNLVVVFACIIFSAVGLGAFIYGKKNKLLRPMIIGIALMGYPYFFSGSLLIYLIGFVLIGLLYFWRNK